MLKTERKPDAELRRKCMPGGKPKQKSGGEEKRRPDAEPRKKTRRRKLGAELKRRRPGVEPRRKRRRTEDGKRRKDEPKKKG